MSKVRDNLDAEGQRIAAEIEKVLIDAVRCGASCEAAMEAAKAGFGDFLMTAMGGHAALVAHFSGKGRA